MWGLFVVSPVNLRLGFFENFKGTDSVLLAGSSHDIALLSASLNGFVASQESVLPIHSLASVAPNHSVELFAQRAPSSPQCQPLQFHWLCSPNEYANVQGKLEALATSAHGHQYFELIGSPAQLVVSVGEYGASWWQAQG